MKEGGSGEEDSVEGREGMREEGRMLNKTQLDGEDMTNTPYDEGDYPLDNLLDLIWPCVGQLLLGWIHLSSEDRLTKLAQFVLRRHAEEGGVKEIILFTVFIILALN